MPGNEPPTCLGMVMCDNILQDPETKKYYLLGTTNLSYARTFPARYQKLCLYVVLTGIRDPLSITIKLVRVDPSSTDDSHIMSIQSSVDAPDPLAVAELTFALRHVPFPHPGEYRFQLWAGGEFLMEHKFVVRQLS